MARRLAMVISHAPGLFGTPTSRPLLERRHQRILRELFGHADVADEAGEAGDNPGRLDAPHGVDGTVRVRRRSQTTITTQEVES